jgi:hypothetical protein
MKKHFSRLWETAALLALVLLTSVSGKCAAVWQWSVPIPSLEGRRAYLWVPPECQHVRGLVVACQNMLEEPLFERPAFRAACAENDLGEVLIFSGHDKGENDDKDSDHPTRSYLDIFLNPTYPKGAEDAKSAGVDLQKALDALADKSGYREIKYAPLMPVGHSSAGSFVWHLYRWDPSRIFAMMPFKTGAKDDGPEGIPILDVNSEWFEYGTADMHNVSMLGLAGGAAAPMSRRNSADILYGYDVDIGCGHCDVSDDSIKIVSLWLKKAVAARIPANAPLDGPIPLTPMATSSGWLLDPATFGKPEGKPIAYADWKGDPKAAFWYLDREMAAAVQDHLVEQLAKKPEQIGMARQGQADPDARMSILSPTFLDDQGTFRVEAAYLDHIEHSHFQDHDQGYYPAGTVLGHAGVPIQYRVNSGGLVRTGPDTFRVCPRAGPLLPQGNPWEPTIVAYSLGDDAFRPAEHPIHVNINIVNKEGTPQTLDFPKIPDQSVQNLTPIPLVATASSHLPVQFFLVSGPATIKDGTLTFDKIPVRAQFPISVMVSAFQWGRPNDPKVQSAGPVTQEFFIQK